MQNPMPKPSSNPNGTMTIPKEPPMYKNKLQEYTQKRRLPLPAYRSVNKGSQHVPKFRSTVFVDNVGYTSKQTFPRLRPAEQDAAKLAYECLMSNAEQLGTKLPLSDQDPKSKKSELYELASKRRYDIPEYSTALSESEGSAVSVYVSTVTVGGRSFTGEGARNRKDAEQSAAQTALQSLLGIASRDAFVNQTASNKRSYSPQPRGKIGFAGFKQRKLMCPAPRPSNAGLPQRGFRTQEKAQMVKGSRPNQSKEMFK